MIEVNLNPGGRKRRRRRASRGRSFSLPSLQGVPRDPWLLAPAGVVVVVLVFVGLLFFRVSGVADELSIEIDAAANDSVRYSEVIERAEGLQARRDTIAERVAIIQEIDGARYVWPHLLDEVARALPDFTWLSNLLQVAVEEDVIFRIEGQTGNYFALTTFMENLEASPFIRNVRLISTDQVASPQGDDRFVYDFILEASRTDPPPDILETVPLFGGNASP